MSPIFEKAFLDSKFNVFIILGKHSFWFVFLKVNLNPRPHKFFGSTEALAFQMFDGS